MPTGLTRERWNERHRRRAGGGDAPSAWVLEHRALLEERAPGRALDLACGGGRHAVWLAERGFSVDAVDISDVAIERLRARAAAAGLPVRALRADLEADPLPPGPYDVVVDVNYLQRSLLGPIADALAPGGLLVCETFTRDHTEVLGASLDPAYTLGPNELLRAFAGLRVLHYREGIVEEGRRRAVASLVARRA